MLREIQYYEDIWADHQYIEIPFSPNNLEFWIPIFNDLFSGEQPYNFWRLVFKNYNDNYNEQSVSVELKQLYKVMYSMLDYDMTYFPDGF